MNSDKTKVIWIGCKKHSKDKLDVTARLEWGVSNFTLLGMEFSTDLEKIPEMNYDKIVIQASKILKSWQHRILTPIGKIAVIKTPPDSMPPSDRRWLLVARSADFADVGPTAACQPQLWLYVYTFCRRWADVGPTVDFYSRWRWAIIGDFVKLSKKLFIMVYLKIIFQ